MRLMSLKGGLNCLHSADDTNAAWLTAHGIMVFDGMTDNNATRISTHEVEFRNTLQSF